MTADSECTDAIDAFLFKTDDHPIDGFLFQLEVWKDCPKVSRQ